MRGGRPQVHRHPGLTTSSPESQPQPLENTQVSGTHRREQDVRMRKILKTSSYPSTGNSRPSVHQCRSQSCPWVQKRGTLDPRGGNTGLHNHYRNFSETLVQKLGTPFNQATPLLKKVGASTQQGDLQAED